MTVSFALEDGVRSWLKGELNTIASFREMKAQQYPHDTRNAAAVETARLLRGFLDSLPEQPNEARLAVLLGKWNDHYHKMEPIPVPDPLDGRLSEFWRGIGFHHFPKTIDELCDDLCSVVEATIEVEAA